MAQLEGLSSTELLNFIIYDTISATPPSSSHESDSVDNTITNFMLDPCHTLMQPPQCPPTQLLEQTQAQSATGHGHGELNCMNNSGVTKTTGSKKRRKRAKVCKNKEEAEAQRMTHITVERNRRKQMNEHLAVLRSLMPDSYAQRGDQATIVGGAIEFVRELEHLLQSLEAQKLKLLEQQSGGGDGEGHNSNKEEESEDEKSRMMMKEAPFAQFFMYPQYTWSQIPNKLTSNKSKAAIADIEVTLIETHASLRILSTKSLRHLSKLVSAFHALHLTILHLSITTAHPLVLYSISAKVEEGCQLSSVDDIAAAVHHMLGIIEDEAYNCMAFN